MTAELKMTDGVITSTKIKPLQPFCCNCNVGFSMTLSLPGLFLLCISLTLNLYFVCVPRPASLVSVIAYCSHSLVKTALPLKDIEFSWGGAGITVIGGVILIISVNGAPIG